jgi:two-component system, OmpR family, phosphate regulon sensor histidine kinase PhoR
MPSILDTLLAGSILALLVVAALQRFQISRLMADERTRRDQEQSFGAIGRWLEALSLATSDGIVFLDRHAHIALMNKKARALLGVENGVGMPLAEVGYGYELHSLAAPVLRRETDSVEQIITKGERAFSVRVESKGLSQDDGAVLRIDEITELQRLGRARRDFVANISHELRTPVTSLQLLVETITEDTASDKKLLRTLLDKVHLQIDLLRQLTDELMDLALIESGQAPIKMVEIDPTDLVNKAIDSLRPQAELKEIVLSVGLDSDGCVLADAQGIRKVLGNLVHNAIKFNHPGGRVEIRSLRDGELVQFSVKDTGVGIPAADVPRVFERFYKVDRARARAVGETRGTGLGLAIAKHIVEAHGGKIWVESAEGKGSTFFFTLLAAGVTSQVAGW